MSAGSRWLAALAASALLAGCGGPARSLRPDHPRAPCAAAEVWDGAACRPHAEAPALLAQGTAALTEFHVDEALALLERARAAGPHPHGEYADLLAELGVAYAYLEREQDALAAFDLLLGVDPGHALSYTLSPKATFLFEKARAAARARGEPVLDLSWPRELLVGRPVPISVEVVADPANFLARAALHVRRKGSDRIASYDVTLAPGRAAQVVVATPPATRPEVMQLWATAADAGGNEVLVWASPERPREIALRWEPPVPWYRRWYVWAIAGTAVAAATTTTVYFATRAPPDQVDLDFRVKNAGAGSLGLSGRW